MGTKSFDLEHELRTDGRVVAEARSVLVAYDYEQGRSVEVPDAVRGAAAGSGPGAGRLATASVARACGRLASDGTPATLKLA